ncbi:MAG: AAA family ATPase [Chloroflexi bacterium]|nr:AAA family ATPase [Chloroflexota bacterium]MCI0578676.1 AAA family ATPase [Chloroflexota bacterium]MCI0643278.1 AAA family ATPase [Chloroflexota bacterium]MCI0728171.1 AAA family ATPase [Chloroflexota bacterium]
MVTTTSEELVFELSQYHQPNWERLGVVVPPFSIEADPRFMYLSTETKRALSKVSYMVEAGQGASIVVGEVGTGKTTLASWFHSRYDRRPDFVAAKVDEPPKRSGLLLLRRIAAEFGLRTRRATEDQLNEFRAYLVHQSAEGVLPLIIIDEAHELGVEQFVELRRLLNFRDPRGGKAYQLILLGRPELDINLREVPDFNDRVATRSSLDPLTPEDTRALIEYRLMAAGRDGRQSPLFADDAVLPIWQETRGYPRSICLLCLHLCLELVHQNATQVDERFVKRFLDRQHGYRRLGSNSENE